MSSDHGSMSHPVLPAATRSGRAGRSIGAQRLAERRVVAKRLLGGFAAMAVVGATLSLAASPGEAIGGLADAKKGKANFAGYSTTGASSPMKIEIYEPTIPLPTVPQGEVSVGYSSVLADTESSRSRASYLWPGSSVGEGFSTIVGSAAGMFGLPEDLGKDGYPVQVNAIYPGGPKEQADEPAPGMIQRAVAADDAAEADNGTSTDGEVAPDDSSPTASPTASPSSPVPTIPGLPATGLAGFVTGGSTPTSAPAAAPALPAPLAALVDMGGFTSVSRTDNDVTKDAYVQSRAVASDITILGGLATIDGVKTVANASSDGKKGKGSGIAEYGDLVVAGQRFVYGSDGYEAAGTAVPVPGLPAQGADLLKQLGIKISTPKPVYTIDGDAASTYMPGMVIDFDLTTLKKQGGGLTDLANTVINMLPEDQGVPIKSGLGAAVNASPRVVFYLGNSFAGVDTSQAIEPPPPPTSTPTEDPTTEAPAGDAVVPPAAPGGSAVVPPADPGPVDPGTGVETAADEPLAPVSAVAGLPGLMSFPGMLLYGGLLGAGLAGFFVRRLGLLALGSSGSCPHGLTSGLPDLRKVT